MRLQSVCQMLKTPLYLRVFRIMNRLNDVSRRLQAGRLRSSPYSETSFSLRSSGEDKPSPLHFYVLRNVNKIIESKKSLESQKSALNLEKVICITKKCFEFLHSPLNFRTGF